MRLFLAIMEDLTVTPIHLWRAEKSITGHRTVKFYHEDYDYVLRTLTIFNAKSFASIADYEDFFTKDEGCLLGDFIEFQLWEHSAQLELENDRRMRERALKLFPNLNLDKHTAKCHNPLSEAERFARVCEWSQFYHKSGFSRECAWQMAEEHVPYSKDMPYRSPQFEI